MPAAKLKSSIRSLLRPLAERLAMAGLGAGRIALLAAVVSLAIGALLLARPEPALFGLVPAWLLLRAAFDAAAEFSAPEDDGKRVAGGALRAIAGVVSDAALAAPFAFVAPFSLAWFTAIILLIALAEAAGMIGGGGGDEGPMSRSDRALLFGALGALVAVFGTLPAWAWHLQPIVCVLLAWTMVSRLRAAPR